MKIGILTLSASDNCGSLLQSFALQHVLATKYGHDVEIIDFQPKRAIDLYSIFPNKPLQEKRRFLNALNNYKLLKKQKTDYQNFRMNYLKLSEEQYQSEEDMAKLSDYYECVICGSDQIWNVKMPDYSDAFFLNWYNGKNKIAYAPSLGGHNLQEHQQPELVKRWLQDFSALSVREETGFKSIKAIVNRDIEILADPTLLISSEEWMEIAGDRIIEGDYIFYYSWAYNNLEINTLVKEFAREKGLQVYVINASKWTKFKPKQFGFILCEEMGPLSFLKLMKYTKYALVQSFHGVIFAYKMKRCFWFLDDQPEAKMDNRLKQILTLLNAKNRVLRNFADVYKVKDTMQCAGNKYDELELLVKNSNEYLKQIVNRDGKQ